MHESVRELDRRASTPKFLMLQYFVVCSVTAVTVDVNMLRLSSEGQILYTVSCY